MLAEGIRRRVVQNASLKWLRGVCGAEGCARTPRGRGCALQAGWPGLVNDLLGSGSGAGREQAGKWGSLRALREGPLVPSLGGHWPLLPHPQECAASVWGCAPDAEGQQSRASSGVRGRPEEEEPAKPSWGQAGPDPVALALAAGQACSQDWRPWS